ncbi:UDP-glucose--hexose-1-phosphate uridylyltransferase [Guptibacillus hwajinpoensis]|uniref:Galactose-1-phosphate uridylyltransferase n=1 Tax=Guptibacillus hwajinpoensis TaxID=208199 RepID=A0A0J6D243_9BACL|nr:UDP-glucose--hexose-1-phosphate uridylyltransferase [Alkalihalobacillus macyae]KMM39405.1 galactose-1-phosphate uridylyltransferase [Alkalihalobacillus macyae]
MIELQIERLIQFGLQKNMIARWDVDYVRNALYHLFELDGETKLPIPQEERLETPVPIIEKMLNYAIDKELIEEDTVTERDLFDPKIMNTLVPRPSEVIGTFYELYNTEGPITATDYFYQLSKDSNYIRTNRIAKNVHWFSETDYGDLEITINLSKPEKDPKAIAAAKSNTASTYPKCLLCKENEGYAGRLDHPARDQHRIIPVELEGESWYVQYSPYVYYNEHAIILSEQHRPMTISKDGFDRLLHFIEQFPHYFVGSNADLPIVGGSILNHDHFQGGHHDFPMAKATIQEEIQVEGFSDVTVGIVNWPMSVIRLRGEDRKRLTELGETILSSWRTYSDDAVDILSYSDGENHNTITPIARMRDDYYELDLVLRNNRTNEEHPMGIFHPHEEVHHMKKENIGLIEVMGLAVLPGRLVEEMELLARYIKNNELDQAAEDAIVSKHVPWAKRVVAKYKNIDDKLVDLLKQEMGLVFSKVLEHAGVFKRDEAGQKAFKRFLHQLT